MKTIILSFLILSFAGCASVSQPTQNNRLSKQKQELEAIGFTVNYLSKK